MPVSRSRVKLPCRSLPLSPASAAGHFAARRVAEPGRGPELGNNASHAALAIVCAARQAGDMPKPLAELVSLIKPKRRTQFSLTRRAGQRKALTLANLYHQLGIDPATTVPDFNNRPMHLLDDWQVVQELL